MVIPLTLRVAALALPPDARDILVPVNEVATAPDVDVEIPLTEALAAVKVPDSVTVVPT